MFFTASFSPVFFDPFSSALAALISPLSRRRHFTCGNNSVTLKFIILQVFIAICVINVLAITRSVASQRASQKPILTFIGSCWLFNDGFSKSSFGVSILVVGLRQALTIMENNWKKWKLAQNRYLREKRE
ncbi:hypothetical protein L5515_018686 [Caenorhabditis briggsae]|uniref:Uncharacterized protein n=1 Tax=Caenorhabditis briggsae TaxID=6238 RepID=A0AAE9FHW2_CAEBR|nr:hypothetical protein L5515_018686 [Caenorhabditis briggsae]